MARNDQLLFGWQVTLGYVQISPADAANPYANKQLPCSRPRPCQFDWLERIDFNGCGCPHRHSPHGLHRVPAPSLNHTSGWERVGSLAWLTVAAFTRYTIRPVIIGNFEGRGGSLEAVEHYEAALARELLCARHDSFNMSRVENHKEWLQGLTVELRDVVQQAGQLILMTRPPLRAQPRANFEHNRINYRVAVEDIKDASEIAAIDVSAHDSSAGVEGITVAAANHIEKGFQLVVGGIRQGWNLEAGRGEGIGYNHRLTTSHCHQAHPTALHRAPARECLTASSIASRPATLTAPLCLTIE